MNISNSYFILGLLLHLCILMACKTQQTSPPGETAQSTATPLSASTPTPPSGSGISTVSPNAKLTQTPKNIIFLVGDGMGLTQITLGMLANGDQSALESYPVVGIHKPRSSDNLITDSAAAATAFATGVRTYNGAIGVDADTMPVTTILELCEERGMPTGLVATSTIVHATPASYAAHNAYRKNYEEIAADFMDADVDVLIGGGKKYFERRETDGQNLLDTLRSLDYYVSDFLQEITDLPIDTDQNVAYFTADTDPLKADMGRDYLLPATKYTLDYLDQKAGDDGFFTMIEGSQIDWGGHANDDQYVITEYLDYDPVIAYAYEWAKADGETLVVVTADHETGGLAIQPGSTMDNLETAFTSTYHTATMIPVFAFGPGSEAFAGIYANTAIFDKMVEALGLESGKVED